MCFGLAAGQFELRSLRYQLKMRVKEILSCPKRRIVNLGETRKQFEILPNGSGKLFDVVPLDFQT